MDPRDAIRIILCHEALPRHQTIEGADAAFEAEISRKRETLFLKQSLMGLGTAMTPAGCRRYHVILETGNGKYPEDPWRFVFGILLPSRML
jgi:hypothetical protein